MQVARTTVPCSTNRSAASPVLPARLYGPFTPCKVRKNVRCNYREGKDDKEVNPSGIKKYTSSASSYSAYNDDPSESLREAWNDLRTRWNNWEPEERNQTLALSAGALVVLYLANALLNAVEAVPLVPNLLKLVGYTYSLWFYFRYLLFAEGRADLARDFTIEKITGRSATVTDRVDDLGDLAKRAREAMDKPLSSDGPGSAASSRAREYGVGGPGVSYGANPGYQGAGGSAGAGTADGVSGALHDLDQLVDDLGSGRS